MPHERDEEMRTHLAVQRPDPEAILPATQS